MVRHAQAKWAVALLRGAGYAVIEGPNARPVAPRTTWGAPVGASGLGGLAANLLGVQPRKRQRRR